MITPATLLAMAAVGFVTGMTYTPFDLAVIAVGYAVYDRWRVAEKSRRNAADTIEEPL